MSFRSGLAVIAAAGALLALAPAPAAAQEVVEGPVTAVSDGMINGHTHCPIRTVTIDDKEIVWPCGGPLPAIGSVWKVTYFASYPSGETLTARQQVPVN